MNSIIIVDYGMGNLRSVQKAVEKVGHAADISSDPDQIAKAEKVILPGVGAFRDAIQALREQNLVDCVREHAQAGKPLLGVCLGLQLLFDVSYEDGEHCGLGIVPGAVKRFDLPRELKIPHMGWNQLQPHGTGNPLLKDVPDDAWFYFVHSYYVEPADDAWTATTTDYGLSFTSMVARDNVFGAQFHPEKSQSAGMQLLKNFVNL
ncbi:MAG: imidazole glycerol phosphate synthase subunit HisH [Planctomycetaceae bacterium]